MKIIKIFNNNAVATITENKNDLILTGSGIGFRKKIGDEVDEMRIEKRYHYENGERNAMYQLFLRTPVEYFKISQMIMEEANRRLGVVLKDHTIVTLTDHICFAVERFENQTDIPNLVLSEIKTLYKEEYQIGLWGLQQIKDVLNIQLKDDEAGYIALHIINGSTQKSSDTTIDILQLINGCIAIIADTLHVVFDENSLDYLRLTTHLKFLAQRIFNNEIENKVFEDEEMYTFLCKSNKDMVTCITSIRSFIEESFAYSLAEKEALYLLIHIRKIIN